MTSAQALQKHVFDVPDTGDTYKNIIAAMEEYGKHIAIDFCIWSDISDKLPTKTNFDHWFNHERQNTGLGAKR